MNYIKIFLCFFWFAASGGAHGKATDGTLPTFLQPVGQWLQLQNPEWQCIWLKTDRQCVWPGGAQVKLTTRGVQIDLVVNASIPSQLELPGSTNQWPVEALITTADKPIPQTLKLYQGKGDAPQIEVPVGQSQIQLRYLWQQGSQQIHMPEHFELMQVEVPDDYFWHRKNEQLVLSQAKSTILSKVEDSLDARVYRRLITGVPQTLETWVKLTVTGQPRVIQVPHFAYADSLQIDLESPLPLRLTRAGDLQIEVRQGQFWIKQLSRLRERQDSFSLQPAPGPESFWPQREFWAFDAQSLQRSIKQGDLVDATQVEVPASWRHLPVYQLTDAVGLQLGDEPAITPKKNRLHLNKSIWLDFDGDAFTVVDQISGDINADWRLSLSSEKASLERVTQQHQPLLITQRNGIDGVEVRQSKLDLQAISHWPVKAEFVIPGWQSDFDSLTAQLQLPPGWSLFAVNGDRGESDAWLNQWSLWDMFVALLALMLAHRALGWTGSAVTFGLVVLTYQTDVALSLTWILALAALLITHYFSGRAQKVGAGIFSLFGVCFGLLLLNFTIEQVRVIIYPQLEQPRAETAQVLAPPAAPVSQSMEADMMQSAVYSAKTEQMQSSTFARRSTPYNPYDFGDDFIQTGAAAPQWHWHSYQLLNRGLANAQDHIQFYLLQPWQTRLWRLIAIILALTAFGLLIHHAKKRFARLLTVIGFIGLYSLTGLAPHTAMARSEPAQQVQAAVEQPMNLPASKVPDKDIIEDLRRYLAKPPACHPSCYAINRSQLTVDDDNIHWSLSATAAAETALALPTSADWHLQSLKLNGQDARHLLLRQTAGQDSVLYLKVAAGLHQVEIKAVAPHPQLTFDIPSAHHHFSLILSAWTSLQGREASEQTLAAGTLQLERTPAVPASGKTLDARNSADSQSFNYLEVTRHLNLGVRSTLHTTVRRVAPKRGEIKAKIPLWPGERPVTPILLESGYAVVQMEGDSVSWQSELQPVDHLSLTSEAGRDFYETWLIQVGPLWQVQFSGIDPVNQSESDTLMYKFRPEPEDVLQVAVSRPAAKQAPLQSIEQVDLRYEFGESQHQGDLHIQLLAASAGDYTLHLPATAALETATLDGNPVFNIEQGKVTVPLTPGEHTLHLQWQDKATPGFKQQLPNIESSLALANIHLTLTPKNGSWLLGVFGPPLGPAILFWGVLAVIVLGACVLYRVQYRLEHRYAAFRLPMKNYDWLLLGVGTSTLWHYAMLPIALWLFLLGWRNMLNPRQLFAGKPQVFHGLQFMLAGLSLFVVGLLIYLIPVSLLSSPHMFVQGNNSTVHHLQWFQDSASQMVPEAGFYAAPQWLFRGFMLVWCLWLAHKILNWLHFAFTALQHQSLWRLDEVPTGGDHTN